MKDFLIVIPTHARPTRQITFAALPQALQTNTVIVTSTREDAKSIQTGYPAPYDLVVAQASKARCIAEKRHWIMRNIQAHNIFMLDDDLTFFHRCALAFRYWDEEKGMWQLNSPQGRIRLSRKATENDMLKGFAAVRAAFDLFGAVGISQRRNNDKVLADWRYTERLMFAFGINRALYNRLRIRFDAVQCREDFHVTLALLEHGINNTVYYPMHQNPGNFGAAGGVSTERSLEQSNQQAHVLAKLHTGFVQCVERAYKSSLPRTEVIVQWKKAYAKSQEGVLCSA